MPKNEEYLNNRISNLPCASFNLFTDCKCISTVNNSLLFTRRRIINGQCSIFLD